MDRDAIRTALIAFAVLHLALGALMVVAPGTFFERIGPYGAENPHYVRDVATFYLAAAAVLALAVGRPSWRAPVLAYLAIQYALHAVNHLADVGEADPRHLGPVNLVLIALGAVVLARLFVVWRRREPRP
jgi:hypothetical protein